MGIELDKLREEIRERIEMAQNDVQDDRKRSRNGMKCFHQGQIDAFEEVLDILDWMEMEEWEAE